MSLAKNLHAILNNIPKNVKLVAVSKTKPSSDISELYNSGYRIFGENKVQELNDKVSLLAKDIEWHMIGHLQRNKVKQVIKPSALIHGVDSLKLLKEINKEATKADIKVDCLLQIHIAKEETKFGFSPEEIKDLLSNDAFANFNNVEFKGLMGMATNTPNEIEVGGEFKSLKTLFDHIHKSFTSFNEISMGMSNDYNIAINEGSTIIRIGSKIFGPRKYKL